MTERDVDRFFQCLQARWSQAVDILLFGGCAAIVQTHPRATRDIDIEIQWPDGREDAARSQAILKAIDEAEAEANVEVQAGERVSHWSMIDWGEYRSHQHLWKRFGGVGVFLLEPEYFALTKLARSSEVDLQDIRHVFAARRGSWELLARACGKALRASPPSTAQAPFRRMVEHFFTTEGPAIWGKKFDPAAAIALFTKTYGPGTAAGG